MRYTLIVIPSYGENGNKEGKVLVATDNEDDEVQKGDKQKRQLYTPATSPPRAEKESRSFLQLVVDKY